MTASSDGASARTPVILGLAALMRVAFRGEDLTPIWEALARRAQPDAPDAAALMDLSTLLLMTGQRDQGLALQAQALALSPVYTVGRSAGRRLRLLALVTAGDFMANTPLDLLLEEADVELTFLHLDAGGALPTILPEHDLAFLAIGESAANQAVLQAVAPLLPRWPRPMVNAQPHAIATLTRDGVCARFAGDPLVLSPSATRIERPRLAAVAAGGDAIGALADGLAYPIIVRPLDTHAGHGMAKVDGRDDLTAFLRERPESAFYVIPFIDYSGPDGLFRKQRIAFIAGRPFASHMAVSEHWMVHYLNAGMTENAAKRNEEAAFMAGFEGGFAARHRAAFARLTAAFGLDYFAIDCAELPDGRLLLFEADVAMIVHDLDPDDLFPYKKPSMRRLMAAFEAALFSWALPSASSGRTG